MYHGLARHAACGHQPEGVRVWVSGVGVEEFTVWCLGSGVLGVGFRVWGLRFGIWDLGFGVWDLGFEVRGSEFGVERERCDSEK